MWSVFVKCLAVLLTLALIAGNAHAQLNATAPERPASPGHQRHDHAGQPTQQHDQDQDTGCCCDCLGCVSAFTLSPGLRSVVPVTFGTAIRYTAQVPFLRGRVLLPEPKPPRLVALS